MTIFAGKRRWLHYLGVVVVAMTAVGHSLLSTPAGLLVLSLVAYFALPEVSSVEPWGLDQTVGWFASQPVEAIVAGISVLAAYSLAIRAWKRQKFIELALAAAADVEIFAASAGRDVRDLRIYVQRLIELRKRLLRERFVTERVKNGDDFHLRYVLKAGVQAEAIRDRISRAAIEVHDVRSRHGLILDRAMPTCLAFDRLEKALSTVSAATVFFIPPEDAHPIGIAHVLCRHDPSDWETFVRVSDQEGGAIAGASGGISGYFRAHVIPLSWWGAVRHFRITRELVKEGEAR